MSQVPTEKDRLAFPNEGTATMSTTAPCMVDDDISPRANAVSAKPSLVSWGEPDEDGEIVSVRNTFIDVDTDEGLRAVEMHDGGAQTWAVSAFGLGSRWRSEPIDSSPAGNSQEEPKFVIVTPDQSFACADVSGPEKNRPDETPAAQTSNLPSAPTPDQSSGANGASAPHPLPSSAASNLVLLQVPLQLNCGPETPQFRGALDTSVTVLEQELDAGAGSLSLKLHVTLKPPAKCTGSVSPNVLPQPWLQGAKVEATQQQRRRPSPSPGAAAAEKRDGICCHWRNGYCRYGEACKFMHPVDMQGIDSTYYCPEAGPSRRK